MVFLCTYDSNASQNEGHLLMSPSNFLRSSLGSFTCVPKLLVLEIPNVEGVKGVSEVVRTFPCDVKKAEGPQSEDIETFSGDVGVVKCVSKAIVISSTSD